MKDAYFVSLGWEYQKIRSADFKKTILHNVYGKYSIKPVLKIVRGFRRARKKKWICARKSRKNKSIYIFWRAHFLPFENDNLSLVIELNKWPRLVTN